MTNRVVARVAKLAKPPLLTVPKFRAVARNTANKVLQTGVCETLPLDVVALEVYQNDVMYGSSADLLPILYARI